MLKKPKPKPESDLDSILHNTYYIILTTDQMADTQNSKFHLVVVDPNRLLYEAKVERLIAPGLFQDVAILPDHAPLYCQLTKGDLLITERPNRTKTIPIAGGVLRVKLNRASVIVGF
jgi:F0F1-type ATP synthase epsilon subunit